MGHGASAVSYTHLQAGHVIFLRIFHGVDQRGGCRGGHFGGEQETAGLHEQEADDVIHGMSEGHEQRRVQHRGQRRCV